MFRLEVWLTTTLITAGVVGGLVYNWPYATIDAETDQIAAREDAFRAGEGEPSSGPLAVIDNASMEPSEIVVELDTDQVEDGDEYLLVGNFHGAQRSYIKAANTVGGDAPVALLLRLAMTAEQLGDFKKADALYQQTVRKSDDHSMIRLLALTGVARAWQQKGLLGQSQELLSELFLRYASDEKLHEEIRLQISDQLSNVWLRQYLDGVAEAKNTMESVEFNWCRPSIDAMIEILHDFEDAREPVTAQPVADKESVFRLLQRPTSDVNLIAVDASASLMLIDELLERLGDLTQLRFESSRLAKSALNGRSAHVAVAGMPLALLLDQLLAPLGLAWTQAGDVVSVYQASENKVNQQQYRLAVTDRLLRNIELTFPREQRRDASALHRGNVRFLEKEFDEAEKRYAELMELAPNDELAAKLSFNLALIDIALKRPKEAIKRLFFAVDQSLNQSLQSKCYGWIGRLELIHGLSARAVYASSRGLALATDAWVRQDLVMSLSKAYLLESDPFSANRVLFNESEAVIDPGAQKLAAVLSAYARYLGMVPSEGLRNEGERMVVALASIGPDDTTGFVDKVLVGRAFFEVGFASRSIELLQRALSQAPSEDWRRRVAFELATNQHRAGDLDAAEQSFSTVVTGPEDDMKLRAQFKLAEIALAQKQPDKCLEICERIWALDLSEDQKQKTLSMMGLAYQRLGRHEIAGLCFAGMVPHEFTGEAPVNADDASGNMATPPAAADSN